jgi:peroxygenase
MKLLTSLSSSLHRFDPSKFDAIFSKFGRTHPNALTEDEINTMLKSNRNMYDFLGW